MNTIKLTQITPKTSTNQDGNLFFDFLINNAVNDTVIIEIDGHLTLSSSFLNSSVGKYIDIFGINKFKENVKISCNKNIFNQFKRYIQMYNDLVN